MVPSRTTDPPSRAEPESGRLESWKEIAAYFNRSVTTVQRWEQEEGLPVHRLVHSKSGSVYAFTHELDAWRSQRVRDDDNGNGDADAATGKTNANGRANANANAKANGDASPISAARRLRAWPVAGLAIVALALLTAPFLLRPAASARITSVRTVVADLERFGGRLRGSEACESPYSNWSWVSDGERVYMAMPRVPGAGPAGSYAMYQVPIAGGELTEIPLPFQYEVRLLDYVPEESALLVRGATEAPPLQSSQTGFPLWLVSTNHANLANLANHSNRANHAAPRRIPNLMGNWADVAPDGRTLAFIHTGDKGPPRLILSRLDGSQSRDFGAVPTDILRPRWAPDGTRLRFFRGGLGRSTFEDSIWEKEIQESAEAPRNLWSGSRGDWTPDGRYFVYDREETGAFRQDLFAQREPRWGSFRSPAPARLTVGPMSFWFPGVSRDGRQLFAFGRLGRGELMRLDPRTGTFMPALGGESAMYVEPSPDGEWLVWVQYPDGIVWKSRADGSQRQPLTAKPLQAHLPKWSTDGRSIVFVGRTPDEPQLAIYRVAADGSSHDVVYRSTRANDHFWDPCWLRDGKLVFSRVFSTNPPGILQLDPKTGKVTPMAGAEALRWPKCSRQGNLLAAADLPSGMRYVVRRHDSEHWEDLGPAKVAYPQWTRDGESFCGLDLFTGRVECLSIASGKVTTLAEPAPFPLLSWVGAPWIGLDADDRLLVVADRGKTGFYALDWEQP
jgi:Tol biopolymer transport system component